ncbi:hypothetical protein [Sphingomonas hengshuiensis]|nr:hypothetical protein [Sphingomonas hengshuiensis]
MATPKAQTTDELQAEVTRLREELSARSSATSGSATQTAEDMRDEINSVANDTNNTALDELYRIVQGVNAASAELLQSGADILVKLNDEATANGRTNQDDLGKTLNRVLPDIYKGYLRALGRATEVPGRMAERFTKAHRTAAKS